MAKIVSVTRAGKFVACFKAEHVESADRIRYELALCTGVHGPSMLRAHVATYTDGTRIIHPVDSRGRKVLGRPYVAMIEEKAQ